MRRPFPFVIVALVAALTALAALPRAALSQSAQQDDVLIDNTQRDAPPRLATFRAYWENDGTLAKPNNASDRHRSNAVGFTLAVVPSWHDELAAALPFAKSFDADVAAIGGVAGQMLYTPADLTAPGVILGDRPYVGHLFASVFVQRMNHFSADASQPNAANTPGWSTLDHFQVNVGFVGQDALGEQTQRRVHDIFNETDPKGWDHQVDEGAQVQLYLRKAWRHLTPIDDAFGFDLIPDLGLALGTTFRHAELGVTTRVGVNLPADFGPGSLLRPNGQTSTPPNGWSIYLFNRAAARLVQYDVTIDAGPTGIESEPVVLSTQPGVALGYRGQGWDAALSYSQTFMTEDFKQQRGADSFGQWAAKLRILF